MIKFFRHIRKTLISENNMGKYFKYAVGEILLVVIGILIALQINTWNENRKNKQTLKSYAESLIKDLEKDTITLNIVTKYIKNDSIEIERIGARLSSQLATSDTLIKIARHEINPVNKAYRAPNNKTFLAMQTNGSLELFDEKTYAILLDLHNEQIIAESIIKENIDQYLSHLNDFNFKYSFDEYNVIKGNLTEKAWQNIDSDDLYRTVQGLLSVKKSMNTITYNYYIKVLKATEKAISHLKNN